MTQRIGFLLLPQVGLLPLAGAVDALLAANALLESQAFEIAVLSVDGRPVAGEAGKHFEAAMYAVAPEVIARIGGARSVTARVRGAAVVEKRFGPVNQDHFAMFVRKYMGGAPGGQ